MCTKSLSFVMKKIHIIREIEDATVFPYAEEKWAVEAKIQEGSKTHIKLLNKGIDEHLYGYLKNKRVDLTKEKIEQIEAARKEAMKKAEARFGSFD